MSFAYTPCVGRQVLVTFSKNPRVLDDQEQAVRVIAAIAEVESVGEETVSLLLLRVYPHRNDVDIDENRPYDEPEPPLELTLRADAILAMSPLDDEEEYDEDEDEDEELDDADDDDDPDDGERANIHRLPTKRANTL